MMQSMGNNPLDMNTIMPFLIKEKEEDDEILLMLLMNSMMGGLNSESGFDNNFNMIFPLLMQKKCDGDSACEKKQKNLMIMMMSIQSQEGLLF